MTSVYIVSLIILLLIALVCYAFIAQSLEKRRKRRQRLLAALKHRQRNFKAVLTSFPSGFLTQDLTILIHRALLDACEQLSNLEPEDANHLADFKHYSAQLDIFKQNPPTKRGRIENPQAVSELRHHLEELYRFVVQQQERGIINKVQGQTYQDQIKRLALQLSVDTYALHARQAQQMGKIRLAIHYYTLARKLLIRENTQHIHQKQIARLNETLQALEDRLQNGPGDQTTEEDLNNSQAKGQANREWDKFNDTDDDWKKKQVYD